MRRAQTVEVIKPRHNDFNACFNLATISKQLYNVGLYCFRQALFNDDLFLTNKMVYQEMKQNENWNYLPKKICNQVWKQVCSAWSSWLKAINEYNKNPSKFKGRPSIPGYQKTLNKVVYERGALGTRGLKKDELRLSQTDIILNISSIKGEIVEASILPKKNKFIIKITYKEEITKNNLDFTKVAGMDLGLNNLVAVATNQADIPHILVKGGALKSINQFWNKTLGQLKSMLPKGVFSSPKIEQLTNKRNAKIDDILHKTSRYVVDWLVEHEIGILIIGKNEQWKDSINLGKRNNQNFVQIPHARLIDLITYKFEQANGIIVVQEESYTSKASALDLDDLPKFRNSSKTIVTFSGRRVKRGLYKSLQGILVNSDINGAINIIRKVVGDSLMVDLVADKQFIHHCRQPRAISLVS